MNERKYMNVVTDGKAIIVKRDNQKPIPNDEPLFIFRAQDRKALAALVAYNMIQNTLEMKASVKKSINDFRLFTERHPDRMKEPD